MQKKINDTIIEIIKNDITKERVDAIVNAANSSLMGGGGVDGAIHRAGGYIILDECKKIVEKIGRLPTGEAVITSGGNLAAKFVIHTVGPIWNGGTKNEEAFLSNAYRNSLLLGVQNNIQTIAFPSISTGVYGYPIEKACIVAINTVINFLKNEVNNYKEIKFVLFSDYDYETYNNCWDRL
ncbi:MAG: O-acetyl-ADP-ribose deacetylase [Spirochaetes bacterium GWC1_27_15]|nr:MAG: O-acetyl-ADP-ribose deacetylase [Spirochaetes bacterium GWB1_27_13]OHD21550.1 MAG: O-acetyl-ADP-ribose deacetylase [Spirochaetes bacterium GWC1_27_15]